MYMSVVYMSMLMSILVLGTVCQHAHACISILVLGTCIYIYVCAHEHTGFRYVYEHVRMYTV
jgi:uncharacterized membrane protein